MAADPFDLARFVAAQEPVIAEARRELAAGRKRSHWMWFVFPQIAGLGSSPTSQRYAIAGLEEAEAYLAHPILGPRLAECTRLMLEHADRSATAILGSPDDMKFHASMTLFGRAVPGEGLFPAALAAFFGGAEHEATLRRLA